MSEDHANYVEILPASKPQFDVSTRNDYSSPAIMTIVVSRLDGLPERDCHGNKYRSDRENWLELDQALRLIRALLSGLPNVSDCGRL